MFKDDSKKSSTVSGGFAHIMSRLVPGVAPGIVKMLHGKFVRAGRPGCTSRRGWCISVNQNEFIVWLKSLRGSRYSPALRGLRQGTTFVAVKKAA